jgi:hypothetical protein
MTEGIFEINKYRKESTWETDHAEYVRKIVALAEQSVLETNKGGQHDNDNN